MEPVRPSADELQLEILRRLSPGQRLAAAAELRETNLALLAAGIRAQRGALEPEELRLEILKRILPPRLFRAAYPRQ